MDMIVVGGGLSGCLTAWRLTQRHPDLRLALIEQATTLGGNHTWSFFKTDLTPAEAAWIDPLVVYRWNGYDVRFPDSRRTLGAGYGSITSAHLHDVISSALSNAIRTGVTVDAMTGSSVTLASGETLSAPCVIDARGPRRSPHLALGFQKFLGLEVRLAKPHGMTRPIIMDATVVQTDGYRFVYTLPLASDRLLIEDTYYSDDQALSHDALRAGIAAYAKSHGWDIAEIVREEIGVLPIILAGDIEALIAESDVTAPRIGLAAALFHPATGYSLPDAVRLADRIADARPTSSATAHVVIADHIRQTWRERGFFRLLNRMLFKAGAPQHRYRVLQRFYGLDEGLIERFYAARMTFADRGRILVGKPPVPILSALSCVSEAGMLRMERSR